MALLELTERLSNEASQSCGNKLDRSQAGISVAPPVVRFTECVGAVIISVDWYSSCPWSKNSHWKAGLEVQLMDEARAPSCGRLVE